MTKENTGIEVWDEGALGLCLLCRRGRKKRSGVKTDVLRFSHIMLGRVDTSPILS